MEHAKTPELLDEIIAKGAELLASDIHLEPRDDFFRVRYRVDGLLLDAPPINKSKQNALISRLKVMVGLDIGETRLPQDGRGEVRAGKQTIDLRVSTMPTIHGEKAVIRLLQRRHAALKLTELGLSETALAAYRQIIERRSGLVLITGPTGSGKTTTLYATLSTLNSKEVNIITIEDPVEYQLPGVNQIQVNNKAGLTFARGLRSILRQDPDIIMIGEIRDLETARIAVQAALTGHLVFATLHTTDAPSAGTRLIEMGIEPYLVGSTIIGVVAQRLARRLTPEGYRGRIGVYEVMAGHARPQDFFSMRDDALAKAGAGLIDPNPSFCYT
ncbi:MAG: GspE/PulE family protein [Candidatus Margulisiibacteriota bacterium]|jgi:type II secretory ATPase GspE/PulE/Tfp pilus assembly ATPase PilB-like protein